MVSFFLLSIIIPVTAFLFESYPRFLNRKVGVDIWTHLLYLKEYKRQGEIPKKIEGGFLVPGIYDYPPAFITILSKFPFRIVEKYEFLFSPFFDALHLVLIFFLVHFVTGNILIAFVSQALYTLTPIIIIENSSATPRSLGYLLFTVTFMALFFFTQNADVVFLIIAVLSGSLIFLSHRFTTQSYLFFSLFFSIFEKSWLYLIAFVISFLLATFLTRGFYLTVLRGHLGNLSFWRKNIQYRFAHQVKGNYKSHRTNDFVFRIYNQFLRFPPFVLAITNPWTLPVFYLLFFSYPAEAMLQKIVWWVIFSYCLALVTTWVPGLRFLGEGQRYLELSAFPAAFLSSYALFVVFTGNVQTFVVISYCVIALFSLVTIVVIQQKAIVKDTLRTLTSDLVEMFGYLKKLKEKPKLLCIPHQITTSTIYHTGCPVFVNADYRNISKIADIYPYLRLPVEQIMEKHKLDGILLNVEYAAIADLKIRKYSIVKQFGKYVYLKPQ